MAQQRDEATLAYVGTYTRIEPHARGQAEGIYVCRFDAATGALSIVHTARGIVNPSFLVLHPNRRFLYSVSEAEDSGGTLGGAISAFAVESGTGKLTAINHQSSVGAGPCHVGVDKTGACV